jgi:hypothetical protein
MNDKLDEYSDVFDRLVPEMVACTPEQWNHGTLTIQSDGTRITYKLKNDDQPGAAVISANLRTLIDELYVRMSRHGDAWTLATIAFSQEGDDVEFTTSFEYSEAAAAAPAPSAKKPWWKFGAGNA